jgi:hypothetical protein
MEDKFAIIDVVPIFDIEVKCKFLFVVLEMPGHKKFELTRWVFEDMVG